MSIRTELGVGAAAGCPVAGASAAAEARIDHISRATAGGEEGQVSEEFTIDDASYSPPDAEQVFAFDSHRVYRFSRERGEECVCDRIEEYGCPVSDLHASDGTLFVTFHAPDVETVQDVVGDLQEWFDDVHVRKLTRSGSQTDHDFVFVDRSRLTDRQREVLETSYEMGYFDYPKRANAGEVADALDISPSTFSEHLAAAQRKLLETLLKAHGNDH